MKQLKAIKQCLVNQVQNQLNDLKKINTNELGAVIDMIKDLEEAMYYCSIIEAMDKSQEEKDKQPMNISYYMENNDKNNNKQPISKNYVPYMEYAPYMMRDDTWRENNLNGRSGNSRRMYMEGKQYHDNDNNQSMKELEHYIKDLSDDLVEMVRESSPEEKQVLSSKLQALATKVNK